MLPAANKSTSGLDHSVEDVESLANALEGFLHHFATAVLHFHFFHFVGFSGLAVMADDLMVKNDDDDRRKEAEDSDEGSMISSLTQTARTGSTMEHTLTRQRHINKTRTKGG